MISVSNIGAGVGASSQRGAGGAPAFAIQRSIYFDGVNDYAANGSLTTNGFQPFNNKDFTVTFWAKADGSRYNDLGTVLSVAIANNSGNPFMWVRFKNDGASDSTVNVRTNTKNYTSGHTITSANCQVWQHYAVVVTQNSGTGNQDIEIYVNGASVDTGSVVQNTKTNTNVDVCLGTSNNATAFQQFKGYIAEVGCWETALSSGDIAAIYGGGSGADLSTIGTVKGYYKPLTTDGPTTGSITDSSGNQDCTMNNFVSPYGVVTDTP
jgi:hypothetical protein